MDLPEHLLKPLTASYWVIHSLPCSKKLSAIERELVSLGLLETSIVGPGNDQLDRRRELKISDKGKRLVEENNLLALIEAGTFFQDSRVLALIRRVPKEWLPRLLVNPNEEIQRAAKARLENGVD